MYRLCDGIKFLKALPDNSVDGIFMDPPWGSGPDIKGQNIWKELIKHVSDECPRILKPSGRVLIWVGTRMLAETLEACGGGLSYKWMMLCRYIPPRYLGCYFSDMDPIIYFSRKDEKKMYYRKGKYIPQMFVKPSTGKKDTKHPCGRPIEIVRRIIRYFFKPGEYVIDPFAGSDTTGYACRELGVKYDTCEIDPVMHQYGIERNRQQFLFEKSNFF